MIHGKIVELAARDPWMAANSLNGRHIEAN
jgi:hypothetical protein